MKQTLFVGAVLCFSACSISLTVGAERAVAQGPAGSGASAAAQESSPVTQVSVTTYQLHNNQANRCEQQ